jgi:hypothetical protein
LTKSNKEVKYIQAGYASEIIDRNLSLNTTYNNLQDNSFLTEINDTSMRKTMISMKTGLPTEP